MVVREGYRERGDPATLCRRSFSPIHITTSSAGGNRLGRRGRRIAKSPSVVAGFARIQIAGDSLNSCESRYGGKMDFAVPLEDGALRLP